MNFLDGNFSIVVVIGSDNDRDMSLSITPLSLLYYFLSLSLSPHHLHIKVYSQSLNTLVPNNTLAPDYEPVLISEVH